MKGDFLEIEEAQNLLEGSVRKIEREERVPVINACGRVLSQDLRACRDQPPFPRSPLDGYALRAADIEGASRETPCALKVVGKIYAGAVYADEIKSGEALRLMTGAPIPEGADTVVRQEDTDGGEERVQVYKPSVPYRNYCYQGEDYREGDELIKAGSVLDAGSIAVAASLGIKELSVAALPRISVISTGDEIIAPGSPWRPGKIYDSNRAYICARLSELGCPAAISKHGPDDARAMVRMIKEAAESSDMIITTGGVSVGEKDIMHDVVEILGARRLFWRVRIKPGSPTLAFVYEGGTDGDAAEDGIAGGVPVLSLSGNPFGAIANFELLARGMIAKMSGNKSVHIKSRRAVLKDDYKKDPGARRFLRGYLDGENVRLSAANQASGAVSSMAGCDCLVEISPDMPGARAGSEVRVYPLA